jgi:M6 family metalloprotease-like protein
MLVRFLMAVVCLSAFALSAQTSCELANGTNRVLSEGPTDRILHPAAVGELRVAVLFVDFPDVPADEDARTIYDSFLPAAVSWFQEASRGRFTFAPLPTYKWYRMPLPSTSYSPDFKYVQDAVAVADAEVDFSRVHAVYVVQPRNGSFAVSPTHLNYPTRGFPADGNEIRLGVTFGRDIRLTRPGYGTYVAVHETLHILGLPDLYAYGASTFVDAHRFVGAWDIMGWVALGQHPFAWHSRKLGWLDAAQMLCVSEGMTTATLSPVSSSAGTKAIAARINASKVLVVENRSRTGLDQGACDEGILVYTVDASVANGTGPVRVVAAQTGDPARFGNCGTLYAAPFSIGAGEIPSYLDPSGISVEVLSRDADGAQVRVSYPGPRRRAVGK